jgi:hypothetical protein
VRFFLCIARISVQTDTRAKGLSTFLLFLVALSVARIGDRGLGFACRCLCVCVFDISRGTRPCLSQLLGRFVHCSFFFLLWAPAEGRTQHVDLYMFPDPKAGNPAGQVNALVAYLNSNNIQRTTPPRAYRVCVRARVCLCVCVCVCVCLKSDASFPSASPTRFSIAAHNTHTPDTQTRSRSLFPRHIFDARETD